jgi:hypothetical protein
VAGADGGGDVHACGWTELMFVDLIGAGATGVGRRDTMIFIYLKMSCSNSNGLLGSACPYSSGEPHSDQG